MKNIKNITKKPDWIKINAKFNNNYKTIKNIINNHKLNTVCYSSACPNITYCWGKKIATFLIMGNQCSRFCKFCNIKTNKQPPPLDKDEPNHLAQAIKTMKLHHVTITSVTRDDLDDKGANHYSKCIIEIKNKSPNSSIEILTPDFSGKTKLLDIVLQTNPNIFNHNIETTKQLSPKIRPQSSYNRSLKVLQYAKKKYPNIKIKSGLMLGLGESIEDVKNTLIDLQQIKVDFITIGQYLRPTSKNINVMKYITPDQFKQLSKFAYKLGFSHVVSSPFARSTLNAEESINI